MPILVSRMLEIVFARFKTVWWQQDSKMKCLRKDNFMAG